MKCEKCKREAVSMRSGISGWLCLFHFNRLVKDLRVLRGINRAKLRSNFLQPTTALCQSGTAGKPQVAECTTST